MDSSIAAESSAHLASPDAACGLLAPLKDELIPCRLDGTEIRPWIVSNAPSSVREIRPEADPDETRRNDSRIAMYRDDKNLERNDAFFSQIQKKRSFSVDSSKANANAGISREI